MATTSLSLPAAAAQPDYKARPAWLTTWNRLAKNRPALLGLIIIILLVFTAIFGPGFGPIKGFAPYSYAATDLDNVRQPPSAKHWFGTDDLGRDMLTRIIYGARSVVFVIVIVASLSLTLGLVMGALAGYFGGWVDTLISRTIDFLFAFPDLLFIFFIAATIKPGIIASLRGTGNQLFIDFARSGYADYLVVMVALSVLGWAGLARLVRGQILALREKDFVLSAQAVGVPGWRIILRYLLPNSLSPILVAISMGLGGIALSEGILAYLGIGLQPPNPSWGSILADNVGLHWRDWPSMIWLVFLPFFVMASVVFAFNFLGDGLNEALNPELH